MSICLHPIHVLVHFKTMTEGVFSTQILYTKRG